MEEWFNKKEAWLSEQVAAEDDGDIDEDDECLEAIEETEAPAALLVYI